MTIRATPLESRSAVARGVAATGLPRQTLPSPCQLHVIDRDFDRHLAGALLDSMHRFIDRNGKVVIGLPFGRTPSGVYKNWQERGRTFPWSQVVVVNIDEYVGIAQGNLQSGSGQVWREVIKPLGFFGLDTRQVRLIDGAAADPHAEARAHEAFIRHHGGLNIAFLGLGAGPSWEAYRWLTEIAGHGLARSALASLEASVHLAFNERGSSPNSITRVTALARSTRTTNDTHCTHAITLGLRTLVAEPAEIFVAARGKGKRSAVDLAFYGPPTRLIPASILQRYPDKITVMIDPAANPLTTTIGARIERVSS